MECSDCYKIFHDSFIGYAAHKIILNEEKSPVDYEFVEVNPAFERITGLKAEEIIGKKVSEILPDIRQDAFDWVAYYGQLTLARENANFEQYSLPLKKWFQVQAYAYKAMHFATLFTDITQLRQNKELTDRQNAMLENLLSNTPAVIYAWQLNQGKFDIRYISENMQNVLGHNAGIFKQDFAYWESCVHPDDLVIIREKLKGINSLESPVNLHHEYRFKNAQGHYHWLSDHQKIFRNPQGVLEGVGVWTDISEQKQIDLALKKSKQNLSLAMRFAQAGSWEYDIEAEKLQWSEECEQLFGLEPGSFKGRFEDFLELVHPDDLELVMRMNESIIQLKQGKELNYEHRIRMHDGSQKWLHESAGIVRNAQGKPTHILGIVMDITRRKQAEEAIENEKKTRQILNNFEDIFWIRSADRKKVLYVSPSYEKIFGLKCNDLLFDHRQFLSLVHNDDKEEVSSAFEYFLKEGTFSKEYRIVRTDGELRWITTEAFPVYDEVGVLVRYAGITRDITQKKKNEQELIRRNKLHELLIKISNTYIHLPYQRLDDEIKRSLRDIGGFIGADRCYVFSYDFSNNTCTNTHEWCNEDIEPQIQNLQKLSLKNGMDWVIPHKQGKTHFINDVQSLPADSYIRKILVPQDIKSLITVPIMHGDECLGFVGFDAVRQHHAYDKHEDHLLRLFADMLVNIQLRKKRDTELNRLSTAVIHSPAMIVITDLQGNIEYVNPRFSRVSGYSLDEVRGKNPRILKSGMQDRAFYTKMWNTILAGEKWQGELINRKKNGDLFWEQLSISPVLDHDGEITSFVGVKEEITEKKQAMRELLAAKEKAEESDRLKSAFLATLNHELRTPLNHIIGFGSLIASSNTSDDITEYAQIIEKSGHQLLSMIEDVFELALYEHSNVKLRKSSFRLFDFILEQKNILENLLIKSQKNDEIKLIFKPESSVISSFITTDRQKVSLILINLFKNAVKFTHKGIIEFGVQKQENDFLRFYVKDSGIGIPFDKKDIIWDLFRQVDDQHTRQFEGLGIGLAITRKIADLMGARLNMETREGEGTLFSLSIPVETSEEKPFTDKSRLTVEIPECLNQQCILLAEDDPLSRELFSNFFMNFDILILEAHNGKQAVSMTENHPNINIVCMDIKMPVMDGYEATRRIKQIRPDLPVIALTAHAMEHEIQQALKAGCDAVLTKPIQKYLLFAELKKFCQAR